MKNIIKKGVNKTKIGKRNEQKYIKKCWNCKTIFTYQHEDINYTFEKGDWVYCPECHCCCGILFHKKYKGGKHEINGRND